MVQGTVPPVTLACAETSMLNITPQEEHLLQAGLQHHQAGRLPQAEGFYRQILQQQPNHPGALHLLGVLAGQVNRPDVALDLLGKALAVRPDFPEAWFDLGNTQQARGQLAAAIAAFRRAIALRPAYAGAYNNMANALQASGQPEEAIAACQQALALQPDLPEAHNNLGNAFKASGRLPDAMTCYRRALELRSDFSAACYNLGVALHACGELDAASAMFRRAIELQPDLAAAHTNLGSILLYCGQLEAASACLRRALQCQPDLPDGHNNLGNALKDQGQLDAALASYRRALQLRPHFAVAHSNLIFALNCGDDDRAIQEEVRHWQHQQAQPLAALIRPARNDRSLDRVLRIGYVSPDFREHSVAFFMENLLATHERRQVEVFCYADLKSTDATSRRLQQFAHHWRNIARLDDPAVADLVRADGIDILVDLSGHTGGNRLLVFARKPAPIQVTYLGYSNTTGLTAMDYRLTDTYCDPPGTASESPAEQLVRLPDCFACFKPPAAAPEVGPLPALARGAVTFASFHMLAKLNPEVLQRWAEILTQIPDSRLLLVATGLTEPACRGQFEDAFATGGIAPDRLEFRGRQALGDYLDLHNQIDIALDTWPYSGHTIACHALWMGVPVVTLAGPSHRSRMVASVLRNTGVPELIAATPEQYVQTAVQLAGDQPRLERLRASLRPRLEASPIMDAQRFTRHLETAYRTMWRRWCHEAHAGG